MNIKKQLEYIYCERCNNKCYIASYSAGFSCRCKCGKYNNLKRKSNPIKIHQEDRTY